MARTIEKGATYLDKLCHKFYDEPKGRGKKTNYVCRLCGGPLETYYCEERLYLVKCADCGTLALVKTVNPEVSASVTLARPTLTPPNEWISVEDEIPSDDDDGLEFFCMTNATGKGGGVLPLEWEVATIRGKTVRRWRWLNRISPWTVTHWMKRPAPLEKENSHE